MSITDKVRGNRTIRLPIQKHDDDNFVNDVKVARETVDNLYEKHPELFPATFNEGYVFNGRTSSSVSPGYKCRRIKLNSDGTVFTIAAGFFMPYMTGITEEVEKTLFLRCFNVPYWGLTYVSGRNDMYWYRLEQSLGRFNLVGTTVKTPEALPQDLLADEKHTRRNGNKHYIAMTVAKECILGAEMTDCASEKSLTDA